MSSTIPNLWPTDLAPTVERTPLTILKEQAAQLGVRTKNLLEGRVDTTTHLEFLAPTKNLLEGHVIFPQDEVQSRVFRHVFSIVAPSLGGYRYELLAVGHRVEPYPLVAHFYGHPSAKPESKELASEAAFIDYLREVFASDETRRIIGALLAQVQS
jgi:hypothetical protein